MLTDKTVLVLPGKKVSVPRVLKRSVQIALAVAITATLVLAVILGNGLFVAKGSAQAGGLKLKYIMRALAAAYKSSSELPDIEVVDWFTQAATAKDEDAVSFMVWLHREGRGVPRDAAEAQRWRHTIRPPISAEERARRKAEYDGRCRNKAPRGGDIEWCMFMRGWEN